MKVRHSFARFGQQIRFLRLRTPAYSRRHPSSRLPNSLQRDGLALQDLSVGL